MKRDHCVPENRVLIGENQSYVELLPMEANNINGMNPFNFNLEPRFLADNIRSLRKRRNWSQEELARHVGLNRGNIASYEKGTAEPKICNLLKIAHLFGVSLLDLLGRDLKDVEFSPSSNGQTLAPWVMDEKKWAQYVEHAEELERVVEGIFHCHCFKMKNISDGEKDVKTIAHQFDQLYEATRSLLQSHRELLGYLEQGANGKSPPG